MRRSVIKSVRSVAIGRRLRKEDQVKQVQVQHDQKSLRNLRERGSARVQAKNEVNSVCPPLDELLFPNEQLIVLLVTNLIHAKLFSK